MHFHASFFLVPAAFFLILGAALGWFTRRPIYTIGLGVGIVALFGPSLSAALAGYRVWELRTPDIVFSAFVAICAGLLALVGSATARYVKRRNLK